jgi:hypothetical protein
VNRKEKLKILQGIKDGYLSIECLQPLQIYIFMERSNKPGVYEHNGKEYMEKEYQEFCEKIRAKNNGSIIWNEGKTYLKEDIIITIRRVDNKAKNKK